MIAQATKTPQRPALSRSGQWPYVWQMNHIVPLPEYVADGWEIAGLMPHKSSETIDLYRVVFVEDTREVFVLFPNRPPTGARLTIEEAAEVLAMNLPPAIEQAITASGKK